MCRVTCYIKKSSLGTLMFYLKVTCYPQHVLCSSSDPADIVEGLQGEIQVPTHPTRRSLHVPLSALKSK